MPSFWATCCSTPFSLAGIEAPSHTLLIPLRRFMLPLHWIRRGRFLMPAHVSADPDNDPLRKTKEGSLPSTREAGYGLAAAPNAATFCSGKSEFLEISNNARRRISSQNVLDCFNGERPMAEHCVDSVLFPNESKGHPTVICWRMPLRESARTASSRRSSSRL